MPLLHALRLTAEFALLGRGVPATFKVKNIKGQDISPPTSALSLPLCRVLVFDFSKCFMNKRLHNQINLENVVKRVS